MTDVDVAPVYLNHEWISRTEAAKLLGISAGRLHRLEEERYLMCVRIDGELRMPRAFIRGGEPLAGLRGTLTLLADQGISGDEAMVWLLSEDAVLGETPIAALTAGRKSPVRKSIQLFAG